MYCYSEAQQHFAAIHQICSHFLCSCELNTSTYYYYYCYNMHVLIITPNARRTQEKERLFQRRLFQTLYSALFLRKYLHNFRYCFVCGGFVRVKQRIVTSVS